MSGRSRSAPFSTHARGVPLFDRGRFLDVPRHATSALLDLRDIGSSAFWFFSMQGWLTLWSIIINIVSVTFFTYFHQEGAPLAVDLDFTMISFTVILPMVGFIWIAYQRRERCLALLSECKCLLTSILRAHHQWIGDSTRNADSSSALPLVQSSIAGIVSAMRTYFLPSRFYSRTYPYFGYKSAMIQIALDRARCQRQIKDSITALDTAAVTARGAGLPASMEALLHDRTLHLAVAIDQLSNVKEFGTPQGIRSIVRFYLCLAIPLFFAPYWSFVARATNYAMAFFISNVVQIALTGLIHVACALEDPFDNSGMDGIFIDEQLFDISQAVLASGADPALIDGAGSGTTQGADGGVDVRGGAGAGQGPVNGAGGLPPAPSRVVRVATDTV